MKINVTWEVDCHRTQYSVVEVDDQDWYYMTGREKLDYLYDAVQEDYDNNITFIITRTEEEKEDDS